MSESPLPGARPALLSPLSEVIFDGFDTLLTLLPETNPNFFLFFDAVNRWPCASVIHITDKLVGVVIRFTPAYTQNTPTLTFAGNDEESLYTALQLVEPGPATHRVSVDIAYADIARNFFKWTKNPTTNEFFVISNPSDLKSRTTPGAEFETENVDGQYMRHHLTIGGKRVATLTETIIAVGHICVFVETMEGERRKGYGAALLSRFAGLYLGKGLKVLLLAGQEDPATRQFAETAGFQATGILQFTGEGTLRA